MVVWWWWCGGGYGDGEAVVVEVVAGMGVVGQVANDVEAAPLKNRESPQVIRCGRF